MKVDFKRHIVKNCDCSHEAYNENCTVCMLAFKTYNKSEIKQNGFKTTLKKFKKAGYFL